MNKFNFRKANDDATVWGGPPKRIKKQFYNDKYESGGNFVHNTDTKQISAKNYLWMIDIFELNKLIAYFVLAVSMLLMIQN